MVTVEELQCPRIPGGFEGEVVGMGLADLLQLNAQGRFSGCLRVHSQAGTGLLFLREGAVIHAEVGESTGEEAFRTILGWPAGRFSEEPNVVTARRTIQKSCEHLLLDARRQLDESRARAGEATERIPPPAAVRPAARPVESVRNVPGVIEAAVLTREGRRVQDDGHAAEVLAGQAAFLAMIGAEVSALFRAGELRFASLEGSRQNLLLFGTRTHYLAASARPDREVGVVGEAIRAALGAGR